MLGLGGLALSLGSGRTGGGGDPHTTFIADTPIVYQGDSITALNDDSGWIHWLNYYTYGRFAYQAGARQAISSSGINEGGGSSDVLSTARLEQYTDCLQSGQAGLFAIGTNSLDEAAGTVTTGYDTLIPAIRATGAAVIAATILPSGSNQGGGAQQTNYNAANAYLRAQAGNDFLLIDGATAWGETYVGHTDSGNLHPNVLGAQKYGQAGATALTAKGYAIGAPYGASGSPADNICTAWSFTGTGGSKAGANSAGISGNVPTGVTITLATTGVTCTVTVTTVDVPVLTSPTTTSIVSMPALQLDITGTAGSQTTNSVLISSNISPGESAGALYDISMFAKVTATDGTTVPSGVTLGLGSSAATLGLAGQANTAAGAGTLGLPLLGGIFRIQSTNAVQATGSNGLFFQWRQNAGATDCRIILAMPYFRKSERTAYSVPVNAATAKTGFVGVVNGPRPSTASGSPPAFTISNGVQLTLRPGDAWRGGGITFTYLWQKSADKVAITDTASTGLTHTPVTGDGYVRCQVTATNSMGSTVDYTEWSTNSI